MDDAEGTEPKQTRAAGDGGSGEDGPMATRSDARWRGLARLLRPDAARWAVLGMLVAAASGLLLAGPLIVRRIVDEADAGTTTATVARLAIGFLVLAVSSQILGVIVIWFATTAAWRTTNELRLVMTRHVLGLDHEFHRSHSPGELISRVDGDVTSVSDFLGQVVPKALGAILLVVGMVVVLTVLDWRLGLGMAVYLAVATTVVVRNRHRAVAESSDEMGALAQLYGGIEERLNAAEDLRANGAGAHASWRFIEDSTGAMESAVRRESAFIRLWWFVQISVSAGWALALVIGAALVSADVITLGTAFLLFQYVMLAARPLEDVVHQLETVQKANGAMLRVLDLLAVHPTIRDEGSTVPADGPLSIEFDDVDFDYGGTEPQPVLHDVDLYVGAGRSIGVVGRTGSGKTTASRLVLRLVEPSSGEVRVGGVPIEEIPLGDLRRRVALVPQEVELFHGSIRDNVTMFDPTPSDADVERALRQVGLQHVVEQGIERTVGHGDVGLSAGEAQLLALARVWLRDPDLVVLDEATARIDPETERRLEAAIAELMEGRTTVVIAHRLSTLASVDDIAVFEDGRIVEHGEREALAADRSHFAHLVALAHEDTEPRDRANGAGKPKGGAS